MRWYIDRSYTRYVALGMLVLGSHDLASAAVKKKHSYVEDVDKAKLFDDDFIKLVTKELGATYQNVQIVISSCHSGGFASEATLGSHSLQGKWSVNTTRTRNEFESNWRTKPDSKYKGEVGLKIDDWYYHGWVAQWIKKLKADKNATSKTLADFAKQHDFISTNPRLKRENPQFVFDGGGDGVKVHDGTRSNHAIIWSPHIGAVSSRHLIPELYLALLAAGFEDATIDYAFGSMAGQNLEGKPVDRNATKENLQKMLKDLRTALNANPGKEKAFIFLNAHGGTEEKKAPKKEDPVPNTPNQGKVITPNDGTVVELDEAFVDAFYEDVVVDDPYVTRSGRPSVVVTTSEEGFSGSVAISLDGVTVGMITFLGSASGSTYELELDDSDLLILAQQNALDDLAVDISFTFASGSFRLATEWDFDLSDIPHYGVGLCAPTVTSDLQIEATDGACCLDDGSCLESLTQADCESRGAAYEGAGTVCAEAGCPVPPATGCCYSDRSCSDETPTECKELGGFATPSGVVCAGDSNGDSADDACMSSVPTISRWGLTVLTLVVLAGIAVKFGRRRILETGN